jgi:hypothetical protein
MCPVLKKVGSVPEHPSTPSKKPGPARRRALDMSGPCARGRPSVRYRVPAVHSASGGDGD